jgi:hypothetical protein
VLFGPQNERRARVATFVARLGDDEYVIWSNTVDAPVTFAMTRTEVIEHMQSTDRLNFDQADHLVALPDTTGTSDPHLTLEDLLANNRAGVGESTLTLSEIRALYRANPK